METPILIEDLKKIYHLGRKKGTRTAVDGLSIEVPTGVVFGFLGPNGAGKTTTIKMLLDFVHPTSGRAEIFGESTTCASTRAAIGYLPEQPYFHKFLKPIEIATMHAALSGVDRSKISSRANWAIERAGISEYADTAIGKLSKGLTQRVGIAQALVSDPKLLILDEPTSGLDPIGRRHVRDLLMQLKDEGKTIFLSSHLLSEVESTCDIIAVLKNGRLVAHGTPDEVRQGDSRITISTLSIDSETLNSLKFLQAEVDEFGDSSIIRINPDRIYEVMHLLEKRRLPLIKISTEKESLEEAFLRLAA